MLYSQDHLTPNTTPSIFSHFKTHLISIPNLEMIDEIPKKILKLPI